MAGEEEPKKGEGKGFAGLSSLVSDVDTTSPPAPKREPAAAAPSAERSAAPQPQPSQPQRYQEPSQPSSGSSAGKWLLGIVAVLGVMLWLGGQFDKTTTSPAPAYSPPAQSAAPSYSPPAPPAAPSRPQESQPPVGQNVVLSTAQIRYCLAEDIRLDGAKSAVNNYIDSDVDRFNAMVADYNSRCSSFKYQTNNRGRNDLNSAQRDIEPFRSQLQSEGRSRFGRSPSTGSLSAPTPSRLSPDASGVPDLSKLSHEERSAIQQACILKKSDGAASYNRCVVAQTHELANAPRLPDLSTLSYEERSAIQQACILKKSDGAASYNRCVVAQLRALGR